MEVRRYGRQRETLQWCRCKQKYMIIISVVAIFLLIVLVLAIVFAVGFNKETEKEIKIPIGSVVSDHEVCSDIGRDILELYGTAVDAAIATLICIGVMSPHSMGIGGGCYILIYDKAENKAVVIDGRETSPHLMNASMYAYMKENKVNGRRIAVPGELKAYKAAHNLYGRLQWKQLFTPTIKLLRHGFPMSRALSEALQLMKNVAKMDITKYPSLCEVFCSDTKNGTLKVFGNLVYWPKLANTFEGIAEQGPDYIYNSPVTLQIVKELNSAGAILDETDFILYNKTKVAVAPRIQLKNYTLYTIGGATGGPVLALALNILEKFKFSSTDLISKMDFYHKLIETLKFTNANRQLLGDPDFENCSSLIEKMMSEEYADYIRTKITSETHNVQYYTNVTDRFESKGGTSHVSVLSPYGDAVSVTSTINTYFGSLEMSNSTGILWNNEMDDFNSDKHATINHIVPGKRALSSMAPAILVDQHGNVKLVIGGAGGARITSTITQMIAKHLFMTNIPFEKLMEEKRFHVNSSDNVIILEHGFPMDLKNELEKRGHKTKNFELNLFTIIEAIVVDDEKTIHGYADSRKSPGKASYMYKTIKKKQS